jgi:hypothetical protein
MTDITLDHSEDATSSSILYEDPNPFKISSRIAPATAVANFFVIVYLMIMMTVATVVAEVRWSELISVAQMQNFSVPVYDRFIQIFSIVWSVINVGVLTFGIVAYAIEMRKRRQLLLSKIHLVALCVASLIQFVASLLYFISLKDGEMAAFFLCVYTLLAAISISICTTHVYIFTKETNKHKLNKQIKLEQVAIMADA